MKIYSVLLFSFWIVFIQCGWPGNVVECPGGIQDKKCQTCGPLPFKLIEWTFLEPKGCFVTQCDPVLLFDPTQDPTAVLTDLACQSCGEGRKKYTNKQKSSCSSTVDCNQTSFWSSDEECIGCDSNTPFASKDGSSCQTCSEKNFGWTDEKCKFCNKSKPYANQLKTRCLSCSEIEKFGWTDEKCNDCVAIPHAKVLFADPSKELCITCDEKKENWTDQQCYQCYNSKKPYTNVSKTQCISIDEKNFGWEDQSCEKHFANKPFSNLEGTACISADEKKFGWTDEMCGKTNVNKKVLSSIDGTGCITCDETRQQKNWKWTDGKCQSCNSNSPYAHPCNYCFSNFNEYSKDCDNQQSKTFSFLLAASFCLYVLCFLAL